MKSNFSFCVLFWLCLILDPQSSQAQVVLKGIVKDAKTGETLIGANVVVKGTTIGAQTDFDGKFNFNYNGAHPTTLTISYVGYIALEQLVTGKESSIILRMKSNEVLLKDVEVVGSRISEKQKEAPLTVESMDLIAIKETPAANFYEGLGQLKGVDLTSASIGFKVINTRGFNSTSPVRSLQLIDGVDNNVYVILFFNYLSTFRASYTEPYRFLLRF